MNQPVVFDSSDGVATLTIDDGKANALTLEVLKHLDRGLDRAAADGSTAVLVGRPGVLSAGFDLKTMRSGPEAMRTLVMAGAEVLLKIATFPGPVVVACTGHAMAAGALLLLAADYRIGVPGDFRIGLNEVSIDLPLPTFGVELARMRLARPWLERATAQSEIFEPETAVRVGFLDRLATAAAGVDAEAIEEARRLSLLGRTAFVSTRDEIRRVGIDRIRDTLKENIGGLELG